MTCWLLSAIFRMCEVAVDRAKMMSLWHSGRAAFPSSCTVVAISPTVGVHIFWYTWYSQIPPATEKEWAVVAISHHRQCLSPIANKPFIQQRWQGMMTTARGSTVHFWDSCHDDVGGN